MRTLLNDPLKHVVLVSNKDGRRSDLHVVRSMTPPVTSGRVSSDSSTVVTVTGANAKGGDSVAIRASWSVRVVVTQVRTDKVSRVSTPFELAPDNVPVVCATTVVVAEESVTLSRI